MSDYKAAGKTQKKKVMGWEVAHDLEAKKNSIGKRSSLNRKQVVSTLVILIIFFGVFLIGCWLAGNPFDATKRIASTAVVNMGWQGTDRWGIIWWVVLAAIIFEFLDASAGMGYGTAFTPLLIFFGFDPLQIVPVVMIQQGLAGLCGAYLHREFENVEWRIRPMSETIRLWLIIGGAGCLAVLFSVTAVYGVFKVAKVWINLYVALLLVAMGVISLFNAQRKKTYKPRNMVFYGALAGFNKGIGGGGYGPVITVGGLLSGVPAKSMMAVTALSEGSVCLVSIVAWLALLGQGVVIDFILLPSMILGSIFAVIVAPYTTRVLPEKLWQWIVPIYCCILAVLCLWKIIPSIIKA
ncbi:MAG: sulfite exporter TauE/SafE family protein [Spirochaetes bacterium]|nr:sulfite exporter TauE/SafE family protein [Spirochaetota bacterium]